MRKPSRRDIRKAHAARKEALQLIGLSLGFVAALPVVTLAGMAYGDTMAGTHYTGLVVKAFIGLFA